jgi:hypothetical protein
VAVGFGPSFTRADSARYTIDADGARLAADTSYLLFVGSLMATALLIGATSVLAVRTALLPGWLGWIGLLAAVAMLFAIFFFPLFILWVWVLVVSVVLAMRDQPADVR